MRPLVCVLVLTFCTCPLGVSAQDTAGSLRSIAPLDGDLYLARDGARVTVFLATPDGIILADPLNVDFAKWLHRELERRFPNRPVKYVVHTRSDFDRAGGAAEFTETAQLTAHDGFRAVSRAQRELLPRRFTTFDVNRSGVLERQELDSLPAGQVSRWDRNKDGHITPLELWSDVSLIEGDYQAQRSIYLGGERAELLHPGDLYGPDTTVIYFPAARIVFADSYPSMTDSFAEARLLDVATWLRTVASLRFDTLVTGDGTTVSSNDITTHRDYFTALFAAVSAGYEYGLTVDQLQRSNVLSGFTNSPLAARRDADLEQAFNRTRFVRLDLQGSGMFARATTNADICTYALTCDVTRSSGLGATAGLYLSIRRLLLGCEISWSPDTEVFRTDQYVASRSAQRHTYLSPLAGFRTAPPAAFNVSLLAGPAITWVRGVVVTASNTSLAASGTYRWEAVRYGVTYGADLSAPFGRNMSVVLPVRVTTLLSSPGSSTQTNIRAGVGISLKLVRGAYQN